jgi:hypothetical protein
MQAHGRIALNQAGYEALGRPTHVELLFDAQNHRIGVRAVPEGTPHAYKITQQDDGGRWVIVALAFYRHYAIEGDRKNVHPAVIEDEVLAATISSAAGVQETAAPQPSSEEGGGGKESL